MSTQPSISVGMPVYNGSRHLPQAIESVLSQTYADFELIISDNASTDDRTREICEDYARRDARIRYIRQPVNIGASRNFNFVFDQARTPFFKWASANDLCDRDLLQTCKVGLDAHPDGAVCFGRAVAIDDNGETVHTFEEDLTIDDARPSQRFFHVLERMGANNVHAGVFRTGLLRRTKPEQTYPSADIVRIAELSLYGSFHQVPQVLFYRREAPGAATKFRSMNEIMELIAPGKKGKRAWPSFRSLGGLYHAAVRSSISPSEKAAICAYMTKSIYWNRERYWGELRRNLWA